MHHVISTCMVRSDRSPPLDQQAAQSVWPVLQERLQLLGSALKARLMCLVLGDLNGWHFAQG